MTAGRWDRVERVSSGKSKRDPNLAPRSTSEVFSSNGVKSVGDLVGTDIIGIERLCVTPTPFSRRRIDFASLFLAYCEPLTLWPAASGPGATTLLPRTWPPRPWAMVWRDRLKARPSLQGGRTALGRKLLGAHRLQSTRLQAFRLPPYFRSNRGCKKSETSLN